MSKLVDFFSQYDFEWLDKFLFSVFGKFRYTNTLSERGLNCYLSNLRSVSVSRLDDEGCVKILLTTNESLMGGTKGIRLYNMVDYKDPNEFIEAFIKMEKLKAFL